MPTERARRRGVATVEAVLLLPILLLLTFAVVHVHRTRGALMQVTAQARLCALGYAGNGCRRVPEGCASALSRAEGAGDDRVVREVGADAASSLGRMRGVHPKMGSLASFPIVGPALASLFGSRARAVVGRAVQAHLPGDRGERRVVGRFSLACNGEPRTGKGVADELFTALFD